MPRYFWANWTDIPPELITYNFSPTHFAWVSAALLCILLTVLVFRRLAPSVKNSFLRFLAVLALLTELSTWLWAAVMGCYNLQDMLPLHLCGVSVYVEFAAVFGSHKLLREFTYALSLPAALLAIVMPGWYYPFLTFRYLASALLHTLLTLIPVLIVWGNGFRPNWRRLPGCFLLLLAFLAAAAAADFLFGGNYMFLRFAPQDTLLQALYLTFGHPGYIFASFGVLFLLWAVLYLPWILTGLKHKKRRLREPAAASH